MYVSGIPIVTKAIKERKRPIKISEYEVWHKDYEYNEPTHYWRRTVHASSLQQARYEYYLDLHDTWQECKYIDIRGRRVGAAVYDKEVEKISKYRGLPFVKVNMRCSVDGRFGRIIGGGRSGGAYFTICFDNGAIGDFHPGGRNSIFFDDDGIPISKDFEDYLGG